MCNALFYATLADGTTTATGRMWLFLAYHRNFSECASREAVRDDGTLNRRTVTNAARRPPGVQKRPGLQSNPGRSNVLSSRDHLPADHGTILRIHTFPDTLEPVAFGQPLGGDIADRGLG